ncbi:metallophosphoesterase family protein [Paenibacillus crassostreae]|uniref:Metallophosphoesterase n=1 Tax=Paenibacillus crassostreae TaxID=1763538 RepID=A0A167FWC8_9BACL|nr:DNA repair exonuclease [Paenibacillus crassostreae]AOZ93997.1 DNA repair exonuclease [Paenibacillus crassostreae]OAB76968.1 metallophosphoesterase [Paenibacillus crassostreae]
MNPFRFIHVADLHLDSKFIGMKGLSDHIRQHLRESTFNALRQLIEIAIVEKVDFIVVSGDVYDAADSSLRAHLAIQAAFEELGRHGIHIYVIHGNHDPLDGPRLQIRNDDHVHVFGPEVESVIARRRLDQQEVAVVSGISYPTSKVTENMALKFHRDEKLSLFHIGILHANVDGDLIHETYSPCTRKELEASGYDYWALGHIHMRRVIQEYPHIVYAGNIQGRSVKEIGPKGCYVVDVSEVASVQLTFHELDQVRWLIEKISIDGIHDIDEWRMRVEEQVESIRSQLPDRMSIVRWIITGRSSIHRELESGHIAEELEQELRRREIVRAEKDQFGGLVWSESMSLQSGIEIDRAELILEDHFLGELLRLADKIEADTDLSKELLDKALSPLMNNREIRLLVNESTAEEKQEWLERAGELGAVLLLNEIGEGGRSV